MGPLWCSPGDVYCFDTVDEYDAFFNGTIELSGIEMTGNFTDPADLDALFSQAGTMQDKYTQAGRTCLEKNGDALKYVGTAATVRDMVAMADAIEGAGSEVNYYGISYGTFVGEVFLTRESLYACRVSSNAVC